VFDVRDDRWIALASSVAHDLRTPLAALAGEVQLALRRERPAAAYRDALTRIDRRLGELVDLAGDLAVLGEVGDAIEPSTTAAPLDLLLDELVALLTAAYPNSVVCEGDAGGQSVCGDEQLLVRALMLLTRHAIKHRTTREPIRLRVVSRETARGHPTTDLIIEAAAPDFSPECWRHLIDATMPSAAADAPGFIALHAAARIVNKYGGAITVPIVAGRASVNVGLPRM
jgi:light-regulated signal transduction histidine kinase (bacteriophytochrome)